MGPCISPKGHEKYLPPKRDLLIKYSEDLEKEEEVAKAEVKENSGYKISEEEWDRMEALAEEERLKKEEAEEGPSPEEINENRRRLQEFRNNPQVDISKSRLAEELKIILEEAKKRVEDDPISGE